MYVYKWLAQFKKNQTSIYYILYYINILYLNILFLVNLYLNYQINDNAIRRSYLYVISYIEDLLKRC